MTSTTSMFAPLVAGTEDGTTPEAVTTAEWHPIPVPDDAGPPPKHSLGNPSNKWAYRDANGHLLYWIFRFDLPNSEKQIFPLTFCQHTDGRRGWRWQAMKAPRPIYNQDQLAARPDAPVMICEGEKAADAASILFPEYVVTTSPNGAKAATKADCSPLSGRRIVIWPDNDEEGANYANTIARLAMAAGATSFSVVSVPKSFPAKWDLADTMPKNITTDDLRRLLNAVETAALKTPIENTIEAIARLAALSPLEYETMRDSEAKRLGFRVGILDKEVEALRDKSPSQADGHKMFVEVVVWHQPVDGSLLLYELVSTIQQFIVCSKETAVATALWCAFTWIVDYVQVAPLAIITAPEKRCGKSLLLILMGKLVRKALVASNISPSATFRVVEAYHPTLLIDEADTFFKDNEELRGIINSGHTRQSAYVIRNVGDNHEPTQFSTWGAKAISGIGTLSDTLMDRAIVLTLRRKLSGETTRRLRHADPGLFEELSSKLARFADDTGEAIGQARPLLPEALNDRAQDNWEPLLAIADFVGGEWPEIARNTALSLSGAEHESVSLSAELLTDIQEAFDLKRVPRISTADLLRALCDDTEKPWATYNRGQPMTPRQLAKRLGEYGIHSKTVRIGYDTLKGFDIAQFADAFTRYLSPAISETAPQVNDINGFPVADTAFYGGTNSQ
ncbi:MAG: DUF3631 domain-containing protein [Pseudomonadota bacterium]